MTSLITRELLIAWAFLIAAGLTSMAGWWAIWIAVSGAIEWIGRLVG